MNWKDRYSSKKEAGLGTDALHMVTQMPHNMGEIAKHVLTLSPVHNHAPDPNSAIGTQEYMKDMALTNHEESQRLKAVADGLAGYAGLGYGIKKIKDFIKKKPEGKHVR